MIVKTFGITREIIGKSEISLDGIASVKELREYLSSNFSEIKKLNSLAIAINEIYATDEDAIKETDVVALIPPVSGG